MKRRIEKMNKCTRDCNISPIVIAVKKDDWSAFYKLTDMPNSFQKAMDSLGKTLSHAKNTTAKKNTHKYKDIQKRINCTLVTANYELL